MTSATHQAVESFNVGDSSCTTGLDPLSALLFPIELNSFLDRYWNRSRPFVIHGNPARLQSVAHLNELASIEELAKTCAVPISAWGSKPSQLSYTTIGPDEARTYYDDGYTLYFQGLDQSYPWIENISRSICQALGVPVSSAYFEAFASRKRSRTPPHFDHEANLNILLVGAKIWKMAPNTYVSKPLQPYSTATPEKAGRLHLYSALPLPSAMPVNADEFETVGGSVVFIPRGHWHETIAQEDSISLTCAIRPTTWAELITSTVGDQLARELALREFIMAERLVNESKIDELTQFLGKEISLFVDRLKANLPT